jgi:hypothetical protein
MRREPRRQVDEREQSVSIARGVARVRIDRRPDARRGGCPTPVVVFHPGRWPCRARCWLRAPPARPCLPLCAARAMTLQVCTRGPFVRASACSRCAATAADLEDWEDGGRRHGMAATLAARAQNAGPQIRSCLSGSVLPGTFQRATSVTRPGPEHCSRAQAHGAALIPRGRTAAISRTRSWAQAPGGGASQGGTGPSYRHQATQLRDRGSSDVRSVRAALDDVSSEPIAHGRALRLSRTGGRCS